MVDLDNLLTVQCSIHEDENATLYCMKCATLICVVCCMTTCEKHECLTFTSAVKKLKKTVTDEMARKLEATSKDVGKVSEKLDAVYSKKEAGAQLIKDEIRETTRQVLEKVKDEENVLISLVDETMKKFKASREDTVSQ